MLFRSYLMLRLMCAGLDDLFLEPAREREVLWLACRDGGGLERGREGVSPPEGEAEGGVHCHPDKSPLCASVSELKGPLWGWSVERQKERGGGCYDVQHKPLRLSIC